MIKVGVHKVSAREVEEVLYGYPGIVEAAVFGVPDDILGEVPKAVVVPNGEMKLDKGEILLRCTESLPPYKIPSSVIFINNLPKNGAGKVLKNKLKELYLQNDWERVDMQV